MTVIPSIPSVTVMLEPKKDHKDVENIKAFFKSIESHCQIQIEFSHTHEVLMSNVNIN